MLAAILLSVTADVAVLHHSCNLPYMYSPAKHVSLRYRLPLLARHTFHVVLPIQTWKSSLHLQNCAGAVTSLKKPICIMAYGPLYFPATILVTAMSSYP